ncbi:MAG: indolepyruvate ferredoxin oxidoreductase subunit beta [Thermoplasmata archaeon]|nr:MAG: indolepyruvate ferredoxin oxidoreductase subunit beta [Thermoplasmata archaeon]
MKKSILIVGVGGQGVLTAANILAKSALKEGYNVITSELHGMAQRGGNVECAVRIGDVLSPIVADFSADAILSFEPLEALRNLKKVKEEGIVITDVNPIIPPLISLGIGSYMPVEEIFEKISSHCKLLKINADEIARKAGSLLAKNIVMLGAFSALNIFPIKEESILEVIRESFPERYVEVNIKAFEMGRESINEDMNESI